ncbi:diguanylate cyclase [Vallitalea pronyensis]|uniref:Diguanylate cyclase n=1 Tax=Vallitalea pronyensis TaxID=1348613 RepID=A0A8J8MHY2_9FIRM|nr:diguanylate cyclase [Vallitalea pronyensis]QUI21548.1 diguanylate cyclase [Vallitalea pronyensis]
MNVMNHKDFNTLIQTYIEQLSHSDKSSFKFTKSEDTMFKSSSMLVEAFEHVHHGIIILNHKGRIRLMNKPAKKALHCHDDTISGQTYTCLFQPKNIPLIHKIDDEQFAFTYSNNQTSTFNLTFKYLSGHKYVMITLRDLTDMNHLHQQLAETNFRFDKLMQHTSDVLLRLTKKGTITYYHCGEMMSLKLNARQYLHKNVFELLPVDLAKQVISTAKKVLASNQLQTFKAHLDIKQKKYYFLVRMFKDVDDQVMCLARDISEKISIENKLEYYNIYDSLTGLYNRTYFEDRLDYYDDPAFLPMGLVICDLNGLKLVNDTLGHSMGDSIIKESSRIIKSALSNYEEACRIGGDEFAVFFPNCNRALLEKYKTTIMNGLDTYNTSHPKLPLSLSIGYSLKETMDTDMESVFVAADNNMYHEKLLMGIKNRNTMMEGLIQSVTHKEYKTEAQKKALNDYVVKLAKAIHYPHQNMDNLKLFVDFHDIGEVSIPDYILYKKEPLTVEEIEWIKRHSEVGYKISLSIPHLFHIADWILKHHEWWNGEGYPLNIKGSDIPLECRLFAIVEGYMAMISEKPYKKALSKEEAIEELRSCAGEQFDPFIVEQFIKLLKKQDTLTGNDDV